MSSSTTIHNYDLREQKIAGVTVSNDRAEVKRLIELTLEPGLNEVVLKNVSNLLFHDSLRVKGRGEAKIHDVVVKHEAVLKADVDTEKLAELRKVLKSHERNLNSLQDRKVILGKRYEALNGMVNQVGSGILNPPRDTVQAVCLESSTLPNVHRFFEFYSENAEKLVDQGRELDDKIDQVSELVRKARDDLNVLETGNRYQTVNNAHITLEAAAHIQVELEVTYQVHNAAWIPSYDIRVDTELSKMNITYFARIRQHTGEDWSNAPLTLTTAQPSLGGQIPRLGTLNVSFRRDPVVLHSRTFEMASALQMMPNAAQSSGAGLFGGTALPTRKEMDVVVASEVRHSALSTEFKIPREATIPNATDAHKVTIGVIDLSPSLNHQSVPSRNPAAFLTASALNTSDLALLTGEASIFLDGAFIAKTTLKDVSPGERFDCSLGVDTGIRVDYKPAKKYHQQAGLFTKHSSNVVEQDIVVKNTRQTHPILITIKHQVPRSNDEKIKVTLVAPPLSPEAMDSEDHKEPTEGVRLNSMNNLEWTVQIAANTSKTLQIKYTIDHPKEEKIEFQEKF